MPRNSGNAMRFELGIRNTSAIATNFRRRTERMTDEVRDAVQTFAENTQTIAQAICPVSPSGSHGNPPGFMRDHIKIETSPDGFAAEVGWYAADFFDNGAPFYPWFVTQGTVKMPARPVLEPAYRITKPELLADLREIMRNGGR